MKRNACPLYIILLIAMAFSCSETRLTGDSESPDSSDIEILDVRDIAPINDLGWDPEMDNLGEVGWHDSTEPFCNILTGTDLGYDVWSDDRGVFVLLTTYDYIGDSEIAMNRVLLNDGDGWLVYYNEDVNSDSCVDGPVLCGIRNITGSMRGDLWGWGQSQALMLRDDVPIIYNLQAKDLYVVDNNLAYAVPNGDPRLYWWQGDEWGPFPGDALPYSPNILWASENAVWVAGYNGLVMNSNDGSWIVHNTGTTSNVTAIWGITDSDIYIGTEDGALLHFNGVEWLHIGWTPLEYTSIVRNIWGIGANIYYHTDYQFAVWDGVEVRSIAYWPPTPSSSGIQVMSIWGNNDNEVFLAVKDNNHTTEVCGEQHVMWWDGSSFHWF